jgi:hypothetical protein
MVKNKTKNIVTAVVVLIFLSSCKLEVTNVMFRNADLNFKNYDSESIIFKTDSICEELKCEKFDAKEFKLQKSQRIEGENREILYAQFQKVSLSDSMEYKTPSDDYIKKDIEIYLIGKMHLQPRINSYVVMLNVPFNVSKTFVRTAYLINTADKKITSIVELTSTSNLLHLDEGEREFEDGVTFYKYGFIRVRSSSANFADIYGNQFSSDIILSNSNWISNLLSKGQNVIAYECTKYFIDKGGKVVIMK